MFCHFWGKFENSKWPPFLGRAKFFENLAKIRKFKMAAICGKRKIFLKIAKSILLRYLWVKNFNEIALSCTVKEIEAHLCFAILGKNKKIQNGRHMWEEENFLKIAKSTFVRYPCVLPFLAAIFEEGKIF